MYFTDQWFWPVYFTGGFDQCISLVVLTSVFTGGFDQCISLVVLTSVFHWWF